MDQSYVQFSSKLKSNIDNETFDCGQLNKSFVSQDVTPTFHSFCTVTGKSYLPNISKSGSIISSFKLKSKQTLVFGEESKEHGSILNISTNHDFPASHTIACSNFTCSGLPCLLSTGFCNSTNGGDGKYKIQTKTTNSCFPRRTYPFGKDCPFVFHHVVDSDEEEDLCNFIPVTNIDSLINQRRQCKDMWIKRADHINRFLAHRPCHDDLIAKNIIPSRTPEARAELRNAIEASLERRLSQRPTADELEQKNILYGE